MLPILNKTRSTLDIVFASKSGQVYAVDGSGNILPGWPFQAGGYVESSPVLADMNGDGLLEVVFGTAAEQLQAKVVALLNHSASEI